MTSVKPLPYGRQTITEEDIDAVVRVLRSEWLTTGPAVDGFENAVAAFTGAEHAVAVANGTAALHATMHVLDLRPGDEVIVPPITFAATANAVVYCNGTPVFADVDRDALLLDPAAVEQSITERTRAIIAVDYAGQPCDYDALRDLADKHGLVLVADASHSIGAFYQGHPVGTLADLTTFSFHPVKNMTTGEGGMVTTNNPEWARRLRTFRNHGITTDHRQRAEKGAFFYQMEELGFNYRITDIQCALGTSQLRKLSGWIEQRQTLASQYDQALASISNVRLLRRYENRSHAYHLYAIELQAEGQSPERIRQRVFGRLREAGIGCNVHYLPVHLHPYYRERFGYAHGLCPVAEIAYEGLLSLPIFPGMEIQDVHRVVDTLSTAVKENLPS